MTQQKEIETKTNKWTTLHLFNESWKRKE